MGKDLVTSESASGEHFVGADAKRSRSFDIHCIDLPRTGRLWGFAYPPDGPMIYPNI